MESHGDAAEGATTQPLRPRRPVSTFTGSRHERKREQCREAKRRQLERQRSESHLNALKELLEDMPDVDTPLGCGYLLEIEGEGAAARAIVALEDSALQNVSLGGRAKVLFSALSVSLVVEDDSGEPDDDSDSASLDIDEQSRSGARAADAEAVRRAAVRAANKAAAKQYRARLRTADAEARAARERAAEEAANAARESRARRHAGGARADAAEAGAAEAGAPPPAQSIGVKGKEKRMLKAARAVAHEARGMSADERALFFTSVVTHRDVNDMRVVAGVRTAEEAGLDKYIVDNLAAHTGGDDAMRRGKDTTSMAVKRIAVTVATTASTGQKRDGDGKSQAAIAKRLQLGRNLIGRGVKLNVIVDADGKQAYARMLKACGRGVKKIDPATAQIAVEHWLEHLTECGIARDVARWRIAPKKYLEHKIGMQVRSRTLSWRVAARIAVSHPSRPAQRVRDHDRT